MSVKRIPFCFLKPNAAGARSIRPLSAMEVDTNAMIEFQRENEYWTQHVPRIVKLMDDQGLTTIEERETFYLKFVRKLQELHAARQQQKTEGSTKVTVTFAESDGEGDGSNVDDLLSSSEDDPEPYPYIA